MDQVRLLLASGVAFVLGGSADCLANDSNPYVCRDVVEICDKKKKRACTPEELEDLIEIERRTSAKSAALLSCKLGELYKRSGSYEAEEAYRSAINDDPEEPAYELFYADYLRNFRGAAGALIPDAEDRYSRAQKKLQDRRDSGTTRRLDEVIQRDVERGLADLYQRDGLPLVPWTSNTSGSPGLRVFFSSINAYGHATSDFGEVDDVRDFTSEALFAASPTRLGRSLTEDELKSIVRAKEQFETTNRLRFRFKELPSLDLSYRLRHADDSQITSFFMPARTNDVDLHEYGIAIEKPLNLQPYFDVLLAGAYRRIEREGIIEFLPDSEEDIDEFETKLAVSRFFESDKATAEFTFVHQDIDPDISAPPDRDRQIYALTLSYLMQNPDKGDFDTQFENRGKEFFGGFAYDVESFGATDVEKYDFFAGFSIKRFSILGDQCPDEPGPGSPSSDARCPAHRCPGEQCPDNPWINPMDFTIQSSILTSSVDNDSSQDNKHYRTDLSVLFRLVDEERARRSIRPLEIGFINLVLPFRHDLAIEGPDDFENVRLGAALNSKLIAYGLGGASVLLTARYDYQRFYNLDEDLHMVMVEGKLGF